VQDKRIGRQENWVTREQRTAEMQDKRSERQEKCKTGEVKYRRSARQEK
jgi:hypothetical protein